MNVDEELCGLTQAELDALIKIIDEHGFDDESGAFNIPEAECDVKFVDENGPIRSLGTEEITLECGPMEVNHEWTLVYCRECRQPIPIIQFDAMIYGTTGWSCPLCAVIRRVRRNYDSVR